MNRSKMLIAAGLVVLAIVFVINLGSYGVSQEPPATTPGIPSIPGLPGSPATTSSEGFSPGAGVPVAAPPSAPTPPTAQAGPGTAPALGASPPGAGFNPASPVSETTPPPTPRPGFGFGPSGGFDNSFGGFGRGQGEETGGAGPERRQIRMLTLQHIQAESATNILRTLLPQARDMVAIDPRTNSLVVRAPDSIFGEIVKLMDILDQTAGTKGPAAPGVAPMGGSGMPMGPGGMAAGLQMLSGFPATTDAKRHYESLDQSARELALSVVRNGNNPDQQAQLKQRVSEAFAARQRLLRSEMEELQRRMASIKESIELRDRVAPQIIERRVAELMDPRLNWEPRPESIPGAGASNRRITPPGAGTPGPGAGGPPGTSPIIDRGTPGGADNLPPGTAPPAGRTPGFPPSGGPAPVVVPGIGSGPVPNNKLPIVPPGAANSDSGLSGTGTIDSESAEAIKSGTVESNDKPTRPQQ